MADCNPRNVSSDPHSHLDKTMCSSSPIEIDSMSKMFYREAVGSLVYIMVTLRSEIAFAVNQASCPCKNSRPLHSKTILLYLAGILIMVRAFAMTQIPAPLYLSWIQITSSSKQQLSLTLSTTRS
jgi:hypothetical protein